MKHETEQTTLRLFYSRKQEKLFAAMNSGSFNENPQCIAIYRTSDGRTVEVTEAKSNQNPPNFPDAVFLGEATALGSYLGSRLPREDTDADDLPRTGDYSTWSEDELRSEIARRRLTCGVGVNDATRKAHLVEILTGNDQLSSELKKIAARYSRLKANEQLTTLSTLTRTTKETKP